MALKREACDAHFSDCVRARANWSCEYCGKQFGGRDPGLHCAHIHGRRHNSVRWSMDNAVSLCSYHHRYFGENPTEFFLWLEDYLGRGHLEMLLEKKNRIFKGAKHVKKEISDHYRALIQAFESGEEPEWVSYN